MRILPITNKQTYRTMWLWFMLCFIRNKSHSDKLCIKMVVKAAIGLVCIFRALVFYPILFCRFFHLFSLHLSLPISLSLYFVSLSLRLNLTAKHSDSRQMLNWKLISGKQKFNWHFSWDFIATRFRIFFLRYQVKKNHAFGYGEKKWIFDWKFVRIIDFDFLAAREKIWYFRRDFIFFSLSSPSFDRNVQISTAELLSSHFFILMYTI